MRPARLLILIVLLLAACSGDSPPEKTLRVMLGPENDFLEPLLLRFAKESGFHLEMIPTSPQDMLENLRSNGYGGFDAVWPGSGLWITLGDPDSSVKEASSILTNPVVIGVRKPVAEALGWVGSEIKAADLVRAVKEKKLSLIFPEPTQTTSGICAFTGLAKALSGKNSQNFAQVAGNQAMQTLFSGVERISGSYLWLRGLIVNGDYQAMPLYENDLVELNLELERSGREPLYALHIADTLMLADSPLGFLERGEPGKKAMFAALKEFLLSPLIQNDIIEQGRGGSATREDKGLPAFANPSWGLDFQKKSQKMPAVGNDWLLYALNAYQDELRKPAYTIYLLGFPASSKGQAERELKNAMHEVFDQTRARLRFLRSTPRDRAVVIPYGETTLGIWNAESLNESQINHLLTQIDMVNPRGTTNIFAPLIEAAKILERGKLDNYLVSVVLVAGEHSSGNPDFQQFKQAYAGLGHNYPVYCVQSGQASMTQLDAVAELSHGRIFDGRNSLSRTLRAVKSYNQ